MKVRMAVPMTVEEVREIDFLPDNWGLMSDSQQIAWVEGNGELCDVSDPQYNGENIEITSIEE